MSLTRHGLRDDMSVTSINTEGLTPSKYISGMEMGETVTFVGIVSGEGRYQYSRIATFQLESV